jgi:hypothetical protein
MINLRCRRLFSSHFYKKKVRRKLENGMHPKSPTPKARKYQKVPFSCISERKKDLRKKKNLTENTDPATFHH